MKRGGFASVILLGTIFILAALVAFVFVRRGPVSNNPPASPSALAPQAPQASSTIFDVQSLGFVNQGEIVQRLEVKTPAEDRLFGVVLGVRDRSGVVHDWDTNELIEDPYTLSASLQALDTNSSSVAVVLDYTCSAHSECASFYLIEGSPDYFAPIPKCADASDRHFSASGSGIGYELNSAGRFIVTEANRNYDADPLNSAFDIQTAFAWNASKRCFDKTK